MRFTPPDAKFRSFTRHWPFVVLFATTAFLRFYHINYPFSANGVDEGVQLLAGRLAARGFGMYTQMNTMPSTSPSSDTRPSRIKRSST
jgi:hypothetical protein